MKFLNKFAIFEHKLNAYDEIMGKMLHLYGSIPLEKEKAAVVIGKIIDSTNGEYFRLGEDINIRHQKDHDKVRFKDYFDSLLKSKDSRGHNFEGTLAGLHNGDLSTRGEKWDLTINNETWSIKFVDEPSKAPELGSYKKIILKYDRVRLDVLARTARLVRGVDYNYKTSNNDLLKLITDKNIDVSNFYLLENVINENNGLTGLFKTNKNEVKEIVFNVISEGITGGWIVAYPIYESGEINIKQHIIDVDQMKELLMEGYTVSPKAGLKSYFTLALSAKYKNKEHVVSSIIVPKLSMDELSKISRNSIEDEWADNVFGEYGSKIRPDILRYIKSDSMGVAKRLITFRDFKK